MKKRLTEAQEFEILKIVLDKFLWLGFIVMGYGVYKMISEASFLDGAYYLIVGIAVLLIFMIIIVREYEIIRK